MQNLAAYALTFVVVGLILGFGSLIMDETQDEVVSVTGCNETAGCATDCCSNLSSYEAIGSTQTGVMTFGEWMPILAIVLVAGIVITLLLGSFMLRSARA